MGAAWQWGEDDGCGRTDCAVDRDDLKTAAQLVKRLLEEAKGAVQSPATRVLRVDAERFLEELAVRGIRP